MTNTRMPDPSIKTSHLIRSLLNFVKRGLDFGEAQKRSLHLIGEDGTFTNLVLLLSDQCIHTLKTGVFEEREKRVFQDRQEFSGSLIHQLEESFQYINRFNRSHADFFGLERKEGLRLQ